MLSTHLTCDTCSQMLAFTVVRNAILVTRPVVELGPDPQRNRLFQQSWLHSWLVSAPKPGLWMGQGLCPCTACLWLLGVLRICIPAPWEVSLGKSQSGRGQEVNAGWGMGCVFRVGRELRGRYPWEPQLSCLSEEPGGSGGGDELGRGGMISQSVYQESQRDSPFPLGPSVPLGGVPHRGTNNAE